MNNKVLHWSYQNLRCVPKTILNHRELIEEIYLKENFITSIPLWIFDITNLTFIHFGGNDIKFIPNEIYFLKNLEFFDISDNKLNEIPKTICELNKLRSLNISCNKICELPRGNLINYL